LKAVFIKQDCLLANTARSCQTGGAEPAASEMQLRSGVLEGLRTLAAHDFFVIVLDPRPRGATAGNPATADGELTQYMLRLIRDGGGRIDALLHCPHQPEDNCGCWGTYPGFLYAAAAQLDLRLEECYLLCDQPEDVALAYKVGCRTVLILNERSIGDLYDGHQPDPRDFPIARDFKSAVQYVLCEEEANEQWGHVRQVSRLSQVEEMAPVGETPEFTPALELLSPVPGEKGVLLAGMPQLSRRVQRWLLLFIIGGVWLSLGIAYLLTHLYRVQPFPAFVWYLTLQFIGLYVACCSSSLA